MRVINISLNECLFFINDQDSPKNNSPRIRSIFFKSKVDYIFKEKVICTY